MIMQSEDHEAAANTLISAGARTDLDDPGPPAVSTDPLTGLIAGESGPLRSMTQSVEIGGSPPGNCIIS